MSPEAKKLFGITKEALIQGLGLSNVGLESLQEEAHQALQDGDFERAQGLAGKLGRLASLKKELLSAEDTLTPLLEKHGISQEDIPFKPHHEEIVIPEKKALKPERKIGRRKLEKYVDDAPPTIARALIAKYPEGEFVYKSQEEIAKLILRKGKRGDPKAIKDACLYVYVTAKDLAERIPDYAEHARARKMKTLVHKALSNLKNEEWRSFFGEVLENYGDLSPREFIDSVILRLLPRKKIMEEVERERKRKERMRKRLIPSDISPMDEMMLCNKFMLKKSMDDIQKDILDGENPEVVARKHGWTSNATTPVAFEQCREKMGHLRNYRKPTEEEAQIAIWFITQTIRRLSENRKGWHMIDKKYIAFRFLYALMAEISGDSKKASKLIESLFPRQEYQVDAKNSFFLQTNIGSK